MPSFCCPACRVPVHAAAGDYVCERCARRFPIVLGIPDFRLRPDPYISIEDDWAKAARLHDKAATSSFEDVVRYYWSITPDTSAEAAERFVAHAVAGAARARDLLEDCEARWPPARHPGRALDLGCRTGGVLDALAERHDRPVGIDIAFRWLIVARKRLEESGRTADLVCCEAERLPFPDGSFDLIVAENLIEHAPAPAPIVAEAHRVLASRGSFFATTWNRLSPAPEPHVRLLGVGWLPRRWARRYVAWRRATDYSHVRLVSAFGLARAAKSSGFPSWRIHLPDFGAAFVEGLPAHQRTLIRLYSRLKEWPLLRPLLLLLAPVLLLHCVHED